MTGARDRVRAGLAALAVVAAGAAWLVGPAADGAWAAARVTVANAQGRAEADLSSPTTLTVSGSGFQSVQGGFGGIYVLFGWVDDLSGGSWAPSRGGTSGGDYVYVPDAQAKDNQGYQRFVAFPGSDTADAANGGLLAADGTWSATLTVPGPVFQATDRAGVPTSIDCRTVTCGVITIGAHGVANATNETFTPVAFVDLSGGGAPAGPSPTQPAGSAAGGATAGAGQGTAPDGTAARDGAEATDGDPGGAATPATVGIDQTTAVVGRVLGFTGQGFLAGEQVVGSLGGGLAAVGPLTAGAHGEVAGVLQLPADMRPGTQVFRLSGAASGQMAEVEFTVLADPVAAAAAANAAAAAGPATSPAAVAVGVAALALLAFVVASFAAARRRRRTARAAVVSPGEAGAAPPGQVAGVAPGEVAGAGSPAGVPVPGGVAP